MPEQTVLHMLSCLNSVALQFSRCFLCLRSSPLAPSSPFPIELYPGFAGPIPCRNVFRTQFLKRGPLQNVLPRGMALSIGHTTLAKKITMSLIGNPNQSTLLCRDCLGSPQGGAGSQMLQNPCHLRVPKAGRDQKGYITAASLGSLSHASTIAEVEPCLCASSCHDMFTVTAQSLYLRTVSSHLVYHQSKDQSMRSRGGIPASFKFIFTSASLLHLDLTKQLNPFMIPGV